MHFEENVKLVQINGMLLHRHSLQESESNVTQSSNFGKYTS